MPIKWRTTKVIGFFVGPVMKVMADVVLPQLMRRQNQRKQPLSIALASPEFRRNFGSGG